MFSRGSRKILLLVAMFLFSHATGVFGDSAVEWNVLKTICLDAIPLDTVASPDGKRIFVLTDQGQVIILTSSGSIIDRIDVGKSYDHIAVSPRGEHLLLSSRDKKTLEFLSLNFRQQINVSGSPFKGKEDAPVVIAVFDDFQ